jgi:hypothetical protein
MFTGVDGAAGSGTGAGAGVGAGTGAAGAGGAGLGVLAGGPLFTALLKRSIYGLAISATASVLPASSGAAGGGADALILLNGFRALAATLR